MKDDESQTANVSGCLWARLGDSRRQWLSINAKSDRHTRVGGPCGGGVVGGQKIASAAAPAKDLLAAPVIPPGF
jgi:hypothetical protein